MLTAVSRHASGLLDEHVAWCRAGWAALWRVQFPRAVVQIEAVARGVSVEVPEERERRILQLRLREEGALLEQRVRFFRGDWLHRATKELEAAHKAGSMEILEGGERPARTELRQMHNAGQRVIRERVTIPRRLAAVETAEGTVRALRASTGFDLLLHVQREAVLGLWSGTRSVVRSVLVAEASAAVEAAPVSTQSVATFVAAVLSRCAARADATHCEEHAPLAPLALLTASNSKEPAGAGTPPKPPHKKNKAGPSPAPLLVADPEPVLTDADIDAAEIARCGLLALPLHEAAWREDIERESAAALAGLLHGDAALLRHVLCVRSDNEAASSAALRRDVSRIAVEHSSSRIHRASTFGSMRVLGGGPRRSGQAVAEPGAAMMTLEDAASVESGVYSPRPAAAASTGTSDCIADGDAATGFPWLKGMLERAARGEVAGQNQIDGSSYVSSPQVAAGTAGQSEAMSLQRAEARAAAMGGRLRNARPSALSLAQQGGTPGTFEGRRSALTSPMFRPGSAAGDDESVAYATLWDESTLRAAAAAGPGTPSVEGAARAGGSAMAERPLDSRLRRRQIDSAIPGSRGGVPLHKLSRQSRRAAAAAQHRRSVAGDDSMSSAPSSVPQSRGAL
jgi:hypothetical protein